MLQISVLRGFLRPRSKQILVMVDLFFLQIQEEISWANLLRIISFSDVFSLIKNTSRISRTTMHKNKRIFRIALKMLNIKHNYNPCYFLYQKFVYLSVFGLNHQNEHYLVCWTERSVRYFFSQVKSSMTAECA